MIATPVIHIATEIGEFLSSRSSAALLRARVNCGTVLDFTGVESISDSFADEFFAVLVEEKGVDWFAENVRVTGLGAHNRIVVLRAISRRQELAAP